MEEFLLLREELRALTAAAVAIRKRLAMIRALGQRSDNVIPLRRRASA